MMKGDVKPKGSPSREQQIGELVMLVGSEAEMNAESRLNTHVPERIHCKSDDERASRPP